ncbi:MAG: ribosome silencing factor [bacterium]
MSKKSSKTAATKALSEKDAARYLAKLIDEKKGYDIIIFDLRGLSPITDYFVICTGLSDIHNRNIAGALIDHEKPYHFEGLESGNWVLLDFVDVIVHIFLKEIRDFYGLERLWGDAPRIEYSHDKK